MKYKATKNRICKLESSFIELMTESRNTLRDCTKLVDDLGDVSDEIGSNVEMLFAFLLKFVRSSNSTKKKDSKQVDGGDSLAGNAYTLVQTKEPGPLSQDELEKIMKNLNVFFTGKEPQYHPFLRDRYRQKVSKTIPSEAFSHYGKMIEQANSNYNKTDYKNPESIMFEGYGKRDESHSPDLGAFLSKRRHSVN